MPDAVPSAVSPATPLANPPAVSPATPTGLTEQGWHARLALRFAHRQTASGSSGVPTSYLAHLSHCGPLRVQKTLFPEGRDICHALIVHPPAGIAGGDHLSIAVDVAAHAHAVLSTPGATKWYKSNGRRATQHVTLRVEPYGKIDWLPQNNIVFHNACVDSSVTLRIARTASAIGWDATLLGRQAGGERWTVGEFNSLTRLERPDGKPLWLEQARLRAEDAIRLARQGLDGWPAYGTLWAVARHDGGDSGKSPHRAEDGSMTPITAAALDDHPVIETLRALLPFDETLRAGLTCLPDGVVLIRATARRMESLQALFMHCWTILRPVIHGVPTQPLRIWAT